MVLMPIFQRKSLANGEQAGFMQLGMQSRGKHVFFGSIVEVVGTGGLLMIGHPR